MLDHNGGVWKGESCTLLPSSEAVCPDYVTHLSGARRQCWEVGIDWFELITVVLEFIGARSVYCAEGRSSTHRLLRREREENDDVDPDARHCVPVPRCDVDDDAAGFHRAMQDGADICRDKCDYAAGQVKPLDGGEHIDEGTAGAAGELESAGGQVTPDEKLACKKP